MVSRVVHWFKNILTCQPNNGFNTANTDGSIFVWMQSAAAPRTLETTSYDVSGGGYLSFDFERITSLSYSVAGFKKE